MKPNPEHITEWLKEIMPHLAAILKEVRLAVVPISFILAFTVVAILKGPEVAFWLSGIVSSAKSLFLLKTMGSFGRRSS